MHVQQMPNDLGLLRGYYGCGETEADVIIVRLLNSQEGIESTSTAAESLLLWVNAGVPLLGLW